MRNSLVLLAALTVAACSKSETYESAGTTDSLRDSTRDTVHSGIRAGMKTDTFTVPVIETQKDTIVVDKPVGIGKKKVEMKRPTVTKNP